MAVAAGVKTAEVGEDEVREFRGVLVMGRPKRAAMVVGERRARAPVRTRKLDIPYAARVLRGSGEEVGLVRGAMV